MVQVALADYALTPEVIAQNCAELNNFCSVYLDIMSSVSGNFRPCLKLNNE